MGYGTCTECGETRDIRLEKNIESNGRTLIYYRCKCCSYQWDNNEYLVKKE